MHLLSETENVSESQNIDGSYVERGLEVLLIVFTPISRISGELNFEQQKTPQKLTISYKGLENGSVG